MSKKVCIISANCQGAYIDILLRNHPEFSKDFEVKYFVNYERQIVPVNLLRIADLLIYQPLGPKWKELSAEYLEFNFNPKGLKIKIAYLTFPLYFPTTIMDDPRTIKTRSNPSGFFPYGDSIVLELLRKGMSNKDILKLIFDKNFLLSQIDYKRIQQQYIEFFSDLEERRDQKLLPFILENFKKSRLFVTYNHPHPVLMVYQVNDILKKLGYKEYSYNKDLEKRYLSYIYKYEQPIHPIIVEEIGLTFFDDWWERKYCIYGKYLTYKEYIESYINYDISNVGKALPEPKNRVKRSIVSDDKRKFLTKEFKNNHIIFILLADIQSTFQLVRSFYEAVFGELFAENNNLPGFFTDYISFLKDYFRGIYKILSGRLSYDILDSLIKRPNIKILLIQNPLDRIIRDVGFNLGWGNINEESFLEFILSEENKNLYTKLLGRKFDILCHWRDFVTGKIKSVEEYYRIISDLIKIPASKTELENAINSINSFNLVGTVDKIDDFNTKLSELLGVSINFDKKINFKDDEVEISSKFTDKIKALNEYDIMLYNYILECINECN